MVTPGGVEAQMVVVDGDELGAPEGAGEADQEQRPIAQPGEIVGTGGEQLLHLDRGERGGGPHRTRMRATDAAQRVADGRMGGDEQQTAPAVMIGDGGDAAAEGAAAMRGGERGEPGGDEHRVDRQVGGIGAVLAAPGGELGPVAQIGLAGRLGDRVAGVLGRGGDRIAQRAVDQCLQFGRGRMAAGDPPHQRGRGITRGWHGIEAARRDDLDGPVLSHRDRPSSLPCPALSSWDECHPASGT